MACGLDHAVRGGPDYIAESGEELQENGGRVGFGVGGNGAHDQAGEAVIGGGGKRGPGWGSGGAGGAGSWSTKSSTGFPGVKSIAGSSRKSSRDCGSG